MIFSLRTANVEPHWFNEAMPFIYVDYYLLSMMNEDCCTTYVLVVFKSSIFFPAMFTASSLVVPLFIGHVFCRTSDEVDSSDDDTLPAWSHLLRGSTSSVVDGFTGDMEQPGVSTRVNKENSAMAAPCYLTVNARQGIRAIIA